VVSVDALLAADLDVVASLRGAPVGRSKQDVIEAARSLGAMTESAAVRYACDAVVTALSVAGAADQGSSASSSA
jgi:hypothetical protein